jgi:signal transduction histidine kinase
MFTLYNYFKRPYKSGYINLVSNPHFWILTVLLIFLGIFYYQVEIFGYRVVHLFKVIQLFEFNYDIIGSLFCIPLIYAALIFWWRGALITWLVSISIILPQILNFRDDLVSYVTNIFYLLVPLLIVVYLSLELKWRDREQKALAERERERRNYISEVFKAQEDERQRIALEIHDDSIQRLAVAASSIQMILSDRKMEKVPDLKNKIELVRDMTISISEDLRRLSIDLRPTVLDDLGFIPSLRWLIDRLNEDKHIKASLSIIGNPQVVSKKVTVLIFRIVQEALSNTRKHSEAENAKVTLEFTGRTVKTTIKDDGKGFTLPKYNQLIAQGKLGLIGMKQRAQALNGKVDIYSLPGAGTTVTVEVDVQS